MTRNDALRYALWLGVAATAEANRRYYRLQTTWLPHFLTNTLSLLLPDAVRLLLGRRRPRSEPEAWAARMTRDNDHYVAYVAPLAAGYILSNPRFNIYKGDWANLRLAGFGLDSLPHTLTALALTALVTDTLEAGTHIYSPRTPVGGAIRWASRRSAMASLAVLGALTAIWEYGEYRIHVYELTERGSADAINMQWSAEDTRKDIVSNLIGWALALLLRRR